jgi:hypothetical protein
MTNAVTNSKITITGTPRKFDETELLQRQQGFHNVYRSTDQCCTSVRAEIAYDFLAKVIDMSSNGYILTNKYPVTATPMSYHVHMVKPDSAQTAEMAVIDERVKVEYIAELEAEYEEFRQQLTQQLLEASEAKEQKRLEAVQAKRLADIEKEVNDVFAGLVVPT